MPPKRIIFLFIAQTIIVFVIGFYVESLSRCTPMQPENAEAQIESNCELLFIGWIVSEDVNRAILSRPITFVGILGALNVIIFIISHRTAFQKSQKQLHINICRTIFDEYVRNSDIDESKCKVSFLRVIKTVDYKWKKYYPSFKLVNRLCVKGRHQSKQGSETSRVRFLSGEGCAGISYTQNILMELHVCPYDRNSPDQYYLECEQTLCLPRSKSMLLNDKSCSFICIPINYFGTDKVIGVISIDSTERIGFSTPTVRKIETAVRQYKAVFALN